jgi:hypothetical protein
MVDRANRGGVMSKIYITLLRIKVGATSLGGPAWMLRSSFSTQETFEPACPGLIEME